MVKAIERSTGVRILLGDVAFKSMETIVLTKIAVAKSSRSPFLTIDTVNASFEILAFFRGQLRFTEIEVVNTFFTLAEEEQRAPSFAKLRPAALAQEHARSVDKEIPKERMMPMPTVRGGGKEHIPGLVVNQTLPAEGFVPKQLLNTAYGEVLRNAVVQGLGSIPDKLTFLRIRLIVRMGKFDLQAKAERLDILNLY